MSRWVISKVQNQILFIRVCYHISKPHTNNHNTDEDHEDSCTIQYFKRLILAATLNLNVTLLPPRRCFLRPSLRLILTWAIGRLPYLSLGPPLGLYHYLNFKFTSVDFKFGWKLTVQACWAQLELDSVGLVPQPEWTPLGPVPRSTFSGRFLEKPISILVVGQKGSCVLKELK